jgi:hypothetical protein
MVDEWGTAVLGYLMTGPPAHPPPMFYVIDTMGHGPPACPEFSYSRIFSRQNFRQNFLIDEIIHRDDTIYVSV